MQINAEHKLEDFDETLKKIKKKTFQTLMSDSPLICKDSLSASRWVF